MVAPLAGVLVLSALLADFVVTSTLPADVSILIVCVALSRVESDTGTIIAHGLPPVRGARSGWRV